MIHPPLNHGTRGMGLLMKRSNQHALVCDHLRDLETIDDRRCLALLLRTLSAVRCHLPCLQAGSTMPAGLAVTDVYCVLDL